MINKDISVEHYHFQHYHCWTTEKSVTMTMWGYDDDPFFNQTVNEAKTNQIEILRKLLPEQLTDDRQSQWLEQTG